MAFAVPDVDADRRATWRVGGITFESYDEPGHRTPRAIATIGPGRAARFKDPAGNLLAVIEFDEPL